MNKNIALLWVVNIALIVLLAVMFIVGQHFVKGIFTPEPQKETVPQGAAVAPERPAPVPRDINKIKAPAEQPDQDNPPEDFKDMYGRYPKSDVGDNMVEKWKKADQEKKEKFGNALDQKTAESKKALEENPDNDDAKNLLFITESLKSMAHNDFNVPLKEPQTSSEQK